jgi:hypothetical protein
MAGPRHLDGPDDRLERARAVPRVRARRAVGPDDGALRRGLGAQVQMRLQQLAHQLPALAFQQLLQVAMRHARSIRRLQATHQPGKRRLGVLESIAGSGRSCGCGLASWMASLRTFCPVRT